MNGRKDLRAHPGTSGSTHRRPPRKQARNHLRDATSIHAEPPWPALLLEELPDGPRSLANPLIVFHQRKPYVSLA